MAFTFKVEDGTGFTDSNSYVSVADADDYYVVDLNAAATWAALNSTQKQAQLAWASRVLDQKVKWNGVKTVPGNSSTSPIVVASAMRWPRTGVFDRDKNAIGPHFIPPQLVQATLEFSKFLLTNDATTGQDVDYLSLIRVDVIELRYQDKTGQPVLPAIFNEILAGLGALPSGGPRFVPIAKT